MLAICHLPCYCFLPVHLFLLTMKYLGHIGWVTLKILAWIICHANVVCPSIWPSVKFNTNGFHCLYRLYHRKSWEMTSFSVGKLLAPISTHNDSSTYFDNSSDVTVVYFLVSLAASHLHADRYVLTNVNCIVVSVWEFVSLTVRRHFLKLHTTHKFLSRNWWSHIATHLVVLFFVLLGWPHKKPKLPSFQIGSEVTT